MIHEEVWAQMLDLGRTRRYFVALYERHRRTRMGLRMAMIVCGGGSVFSLVGTAPPELGAILGAVLAACAAYDWAADPGRKAAACHQFGVRFSALQDDYRRLWRALTSLDPDEAEERLRALETKQRLVDEAVGTAEVQLGDQRLNERCAEEEYAVATRQYA